jgi:hypothetical protein
MSGAVSPCRRGIALATLAIVVALTPASAEANATMFVGAASDWPRSNVFEDSKAQFELAKSAGLNAIRTTALWSPGMTEPTAEQISIFETTARAAALSGIRVIVSVYPASNREVPLDAAARAEFATYSAGLARSVPTLRDFIIGNEPNLNYFWLPQYNAKGKSSSPAAYVLMLATAYDAIKGRRSHDQRHRRLCLTARNGSTAR